MESLGQLPNLAEVIFGPSHLQSPILALTKSDPQIGLMLHV